MQTLRVPKHSNKNDIPQRVAENVTATQMPLISFKNNRQEAIHNIQLQKIANSSPQVQKLVALQQMANQTLGKPPVQLKSLPTEITNNPAPVQRVVFVKNAAGHTRREEDDEYELQDGEDFDDEALMAYYDDEEAREEEERKRAQHEAKARQEREEQEKQEAIAAREAGLRGVPKTVTRTDRNFANVQNSRGQGKAHTTPHGLAPAGDTSIPVSEQLNQQSLHKGTSDLISFTGPRPEARAMEYGGGAAPQITLKLKKIARAKARGKPDAQHLDVITNADLLEDDDVAGSRELTRYAQIDDEHQVRVRAPDGGGRQTIGRRFMYGAGIDEEHDSDSDSEAD